jgi:hypothetical protein
MLGSANQRPGVYGVYSASAFIYVGDSEDIRASLLELFSGGNRCVALARPTGFIFEIVPGFAARTL